MKILNLIIILYMQDFRKRPTWKPGQYTNLIRDILTKLNNSKKLNEAKEKFMKKMNELGIAYSGYGFAFDLYKEVEDAALIPIEDMKSYRRMK